MGADLGGEAADETDQTMLRGVVGGPLRVRGLGIGGGIEELHAAATLLDHRRQRVLGDQEGRLQVDGHDPVPHRLVHVDDLRVVGNPGIVHDHVDAAEPLDGGSAHRLDRRRLGQVGGDGEGLAAGTGDRFQRVRRPRLAPRVNRNRRALRRIGLGDRAPDAACRSRDERPLAFQTYSHGSLPKTADSVTGPSKRRRDRSAAPCRSRAAPTPGLRARSVPSPSRSPSGPAQGRGVRSARPARSSASPCAARG